MIGSSNVSNVLLKTSLTTMARPTCNTTLFEYNKDTNLRALRDGIDHRQYCAWDPSGQNDAWFVLYLKQIFIFK